MTIDLSDDPQKVIEKITIERDGALLRLEEARELIKGLKLEIANEAKMNAFYAALAKAQGEYTEIEKNQTGKISYEGRDGRAGGSYEFKYADMASILRGTRPALSKNGLALLQPPSAQEVRTILAHESGGVMTSVLPLPDSKQVGDPKKWAAIFSYMRRYAASGLLCVAAEDDIDAGPEGPEDANQSDEAKAAEYKIVIEAAEAAAKKGQAAWDAHWKAMSNDYMNLIAKDVPRLKRMAAAANANPSKES